MNEQKTVSDAQVARVLGTIVAAHAIKWAIIIGLTRAARRALEDAS